MKTINGILNQISPRSINILEKIRILHLLIFMCLISFSFKIGHSLHTFYDSFSNNPAFSFEDDEKKKTEKVMFEDQRGIPKLESSKDELKKMTEDTKEDKIDLNDKREKLVEIIEKMSPTKAALMLEDMETGEASVIIESIKSSSASAILSLMSTEKSGKITKGMLESISPATDMATKK